MFERLRTRSTRYCDIDFSSEVAADEQRDAAGVASQVQCGLPGGVGGADDVDVAAFGRTGVVRRRAVEDPSSGVLGEPLALQQAIRDPGGDDDGASVDLGAVTEADGVHRAALLERLHAAGDDHLGAEAARLLRRPDRQTPRSARGEAEVVLDPALWAA